MGTNYKVETVQVQVDDFNNIATELADLLEENNISTTDILDFEVVLLGTNYLLVVAFKGITPLTQSKSLSGIIGLVTPIIGLLRKLNRTISPQIGLKVSSIKTAFKGSQKPAAVSMGLKFLAFVKAFSKKPLVNSIALASTLVKGLFTHVEKVTTLTGLKVKQIEIWYNGVPIEE